MIPFKYHLQSHLVNAPPSHYPVFVDRFDSSSDFHLRFATLRKERGLTQQTLADRIGKDERCPDDDLRLQFEAVSRFDEEEKRVVRSLLEGMILKHEVRRWQTVSTGGERK